MLCLYLLLQLCVTVMNKKWQGFYTIIRQQRYSQSCIDVCVKERARLVGPDPHAIVLHAPDSIFWKTECFFPNGSIVGSLY